MAVSPSVCKPSHNCTAPRPRRLEVGTKSAEDVKVKEKRFQETEIRRKTMNVPREKISRETYINPTEKVTELNNLMSDKKQQYQDLKEEFKSELRHTFPNASEERLQVMAAPSLPFFFWLKT